MRVIISYHWFINLTELLNGDLAIKNRGGIISKNLMDRECKCSLPSKVNIKCLYEGKSWSKCEIYEVKWSMCDTIYKGSTHQTQNKLTVVSPISYVYSRRDRNHIHFLLILSSTLILPRHVQIYVSIWRLG